jgi:diaminopimelate decarboxylase
VAGVTELIRPALYGSRHPTYALPAAPLGSDNANGFFYDTVVEGPVCESTDTFGSYSLPRLRRGDLVAIGEDGAYSASFTSRFIVH